MEWILPLNSQGSDSFFQFYPRPCWYCSSSTGSFAFLRLRLKKKLQVIVSFCPDFPELYGFPYKKAAARGRMTATGCGSAVFNGG